MSLQSTGLSNTGKTKTSTFFDPTLGLSLVFNGKNSTVRFKAASAAMTNISVRVNHAVPVGAPECDPCGNDTVDVSAELRLNVVEGNLTSITALRALLDSVVDQALANYQLGYGMVPPSSAVFTDLPETVSA